MSNEADAVREFIAEARAKGDEHICLAFDFALAALAAERRQTVERIKKVIGTRAAVGSLGIGSGAYAAVLAILDAEAQRP
jgi:hypothetical protein